MRKTLFSGIAACLLATAATAAEQSPSVIWTVGQADRSASEFALAPDRFRDFLANDFGYEDKYFLVGHSVPAADFPYVLPGPADTWGGTWPTSGWRTHQVNILFGLKEIPSDGTCTLVVDLLDYAKNFLPLVKVSVNTQDAKNQVTKVMSFDDFVKHISDHNGVFTRGTVKGVVSDTCSCLVEQLLNGYKVQFGELGIFSISITCEPADTLKDFSSDNIKAVNILFNPGIDFENLRSKAEFNLVTSRAIQAASLKAVKENKDTVDLAALKKGDSESPDEI